MSSSTTTGTELLYLRVNLPQEAAFMLKSRVVLVVENDLLRTQLRNYDQYYTLGIDEQ
ncbi:hypothetical protein [Nostoc sp.]|uniref:hypothetical protein n=1 Tax=Nostoc sp. TaxID=1180 RepID=UPI003FA59AB2